MNNTLEKQEVTLEEKVSNYKEATATLTEKLFDARNNYDACYSMLHMLIDSICNNEKHIYLHVLASLEKLKQDNLDFETENGGHTMDMSQELFTELMDDLTGTFNIVHADYGTGIE